MLPLAAGDSVGYSELFVEKTYHSYYDPMRGIRTDGWKYIRNFEAGLVSRCLPTSLGAGRIVTWVGRMEPSVHAPVELYDLQSDPSEWTNLAGCPDYASVQAEMEARLVNWMRETGDPLLDGPVASPFYRRAVRALAG